MKKVDSFIGSTFTTPKGGVLTVVGVNGLTGNVKKYEVTCSVCSKDEELFPNPFMVTKGHLMSGQSPCGCTKFKWSVGQFTTLCRRKCDDLGYEFKGFSGEFKGAHTKVKIHNRVTGNTWCSTSITHFLNSKVRDPVSHLIKLSELSRLPDEHHVLGFIKAGFSSKDVFTKIPNVNGQSCWLFTCHKCKNDEYTLTGVCDGSFKANTSGLKKGFKPCRCSANYHWTKEQREYQIKSICEDEGLTWLGWITNNYKVSGKFRWLCSKGHLCEDTNVSNFLYHGKRCKTCSNLETRFNGFYPERRDETDFLYLFDCGDSTKIGRSFDICRRTKDLSSHKFLGFTPELLQSYTATHQVVYDTEQAIHTELRERGFQFDCDWTTECFTKDCWYVLQEILEDYVSSGVLERVT